MAKKNAREEPPSPGPQVSENVQMSDIVFILDKMELLLKAVSEIGKDGKFKDPTRFGILSVREGSLDDPEVRQASCASPPTTPSAERTAAPTWFILSTSTKAPTSSALWGRTNEQKTK